MNKIKNLVVSASAGTGKTYRLSLEYIAALSKKSNAEAIDYKNILVMTFTRKATAEIKEGILKKLSEFIEIYDICKNSKLSTKDTILNNENLDEKKKNNYINLIESIEKIEEDLTVNKEFLENLANIYKDIIRNKEKLKIYTIDAFLNIIFKNIVVNLMKIKSYSLIDEEENSAYYKKILESIFTNKKLFNDFKNFFTENSEKNIDKYISIIGNLISSRWKYILSLNDSKEYIKKEKFTINEKPEKILRELLSYLENDAKKDLYDVLKKDCTSYIGKTLEAQRELLFKNFKFFFKEGTGALIYNGNKLKKESDSEHKDYLISRQEVLKENLAKEVYNEVLIPYEEKIFELSLEIFRLYDMFKVRDKNFTFNDIAIYTYMAIFNKENGLIDENGLTDVFFESLDMNIETIFIDEFQDTSILQWKILYEFTKKAKIVVCVGDDKQSIYGWRDGEKRLFENLKTILDAKKDPLTKSYRSDINIVSYCNELFSSISKIDNWPFSPSEINSKNQGYVKAICMSDYDEEATIYSVLLKELRRFAPYDNVAIIARTNGELNEIAQLLESENIPYILNNEKNISEYPGIFECFELLKFLIYGDELALFNFISSPLSNIGTKDIEILLKNKDELLSYINFSQDNEFINSLENKKLINFLDKIIDTKKKFKNFKVQNLIYEIIKKFQFLDYFVKLNEDNEISEINEVKNIYDFYLLTNSYHSVIELLNAYNENQILLSDKNSTKRGIELVTIHKSKGLEFKTTFVIKNDKKSKYSDIDFLFEMNEKYDKTTFSLFAKKGYKSILETCFEDKVAEYNKKIVEEEINNFYVALTRPKNNLVVIYNDRLFEEKPLKNSILKDFFSCEIGEIHKANEIIEEEASEETPYNSSSYFVDASNENEEINDFEVNNSKFLLETEEKRMTGILVHYFFENLKYGSEEEVAFAKNLCYKKYLSYFGKKKLDEIFSKENIEIFLNKDKEIFSKKWNHIYNEYVLYDAIDKKEYRIDRLMIKDNDDGTGEIYIVDYKTGGKNENQLKTYASVLKKTFKELKNYEIKTNFLEFDVF